jgi:hypothetical protein
MRFTRDAPPFPGFSTGDQSHIHSFRGASIARLAGLT